MNRKIPLLHCLQLSKRYKDGRLYIDILKNINFIMNYSEMIAIVGSSGSGKSTLLNLLGGLDDPTYGKVFFEGKLFNKLSSKERSIIRNKRLGFIYQFHHLLSDFNALENVAMPMLISGVKLVKALEEAKKMLSLVGLERYGHYHPYELSGGECQRIAIARALINQPILILADEPTGNLDKHTANNIFNLLNELNIRLGTAFLIATHDLCLVNKLHKQLRICDGMLQINNPISII